MTGQDVKRQVMEALDHECASWQFTGKAAAALAPCIVLTPEEALPILRDAHEECGCDRPGDPSSCIGEPLWAFALLSPDEAGDE